MPWWRRPRTRSRGRCPRGAGELAGDAERTGAFVVSPIAALATVLAWYQSVLDPGLPRCRAGGLGADGRC